MKCHVLSCDVMFRRRPAPLRRPHRSAARLHPAYRSSFRFRSVPAAAGLPAARPFFARIACAHAPAFAPARFARLIAPARAKRRAHFSRPFRRVFFAPARGGRRSGLRKPLPPVSSYHGFAGVKPLPGIISEFMNKLLPPGEDTGTCHEMSCSAAARRRPLSMPAYHTFPHVKPAPKARPAASAEPGERSLQRRAPAGEFAALPPLVLDHLGRGAGEEPLIAELVVDP